MAKPDGRLAPCDAPARSSRLAKAEEFWRSAEDLEAVSDTGPTNTLVSLYVLAGIAAADVICCAALGGYSRSENHAEAVRLLSSVDATLAPSLRRLLARKSKAAYQPESVSAADLAQTRTAAERLLQAAREI